MSITLYNLVEAVKDEIASASTVNVAQANETMLEGVNDTVTVQVYPGNGEGASNSRTDRTTFGSSSATPMRQKRWTLFVDVYAAQRSNLAEDMVAVTNTADGIIDQLEKQSSNPPFSLAGVQTFKYTWERVTFVYGDAQTRYAGIRFTLDFIVG